MLPTMAAPGELVLTGLRELIAVLAQAANDVAVTGVDVGAEVLHVALAGLAPLHEPRLQVAQLLLAGRRQLVGVLLEAVTEAAGSRCDVRAELLHVRTTGAGAVFGARRQRCHRQRGGPCCKPGD